MKKLMVMVGMAWFCIAKSQPAIFIDSLAVWNNDSAQVTYQGNLVIDGIFDSQGQDIFIGGEVTISGSSSDIVFGSIRKRNTGNMILDQNITCNAFTWETDGLVVIRNFDTLTILGNDTSMCSGYSPDRFFDVGNDQGFLARSIQQLNRSYIFPIGNQSLSLQSFVINVQDFYSDTNRLFSLTLHEGSAGTIYYDSLFDYTFFQDSSGNCVSENNPSRILFDCLSDVTWVGHGSDLWNYYVTVSSDPCGGLPYRVIGSDSSYYWNDPMIAVVGNVENNLCTFSTWNHSDVISGGLYQGCNRQFAVTGNNGTVLPVELVTFDVIARDRCVDIVWQTESETNNAMFEILRSLNGIDFEIIATIPGSGTTDQSHQYLYQDCELLPLQRYYYQLRQIDYDDQSFLSQVVSVRSGNYPEQVACYDITGRFLGMRSYQSYKNGELATEFQQMVFVQIGQKTVRLALRQF